jgi:mono/diheme cytochrome c family protein
VTCFRSLWAIATPVVILVVAAGGCTRKIPPPTASGSGAVSGSEQLANRGRTVYQTNCTACHNSNPKQPGALGPEIWGSSRALVEARVMKAAYPDGYTPKRASHTMQPLPQLQADLDALHAYLNSSL